MYFESICVFSEIILEKMRKILITGASRGIGLFLLQSFVKRHCSVYGTFGSTVPPEGLLPYFTQVDITYQDQVNNWIKTSVSETDQIILINCAGINYNVLGRKADMDLWKRVIDVNLVGTFRVINAVLPLMYVNSFGRVINFSSIVAQKGVNGTSAYAASKAALWGLGKCLALENASHGITVNTVNLGYMDAGMTLESVPEKLREDIYKQIPLKRFGSLGEVLKTVDYLIDTEYITGTTIDLNGGLY